LEGEKIMKLRKVLAGVAVASMLVGCGNSTDSGSTANYAKVGYAVETHDVGSNGQVNTYAAVVGLDADGKIKYVSIDVAQQNPTKENESTKTKKEKGDEYGMVGSSTIGKEWYEQIAALEEAMVGMTAADVKAIETYEKDASHTAVPKEGTDLAASVTISIDGYQDIVVAAIENAVKVDGLAKVGLGTDISIDTTKVQVNATFGFVGLDADGKIVWSYIDVAQTKGEEGANTKTKKEKGTEYGMVGSSTIGKEWFEQAEALEKAMVGMTAADVKAIETYKKDDSHPAVPKEGTDLAASVTITIDSYQAAIVEAISNAK